MGKRPMNIMTHRVCGHEPNGDAFSVTFVLSNVKRAVLRECNVKTRTLISPDSPDTKVKTLHFLLDIDDGECHLLYFYEGEGELCVFEELDALQKAIEMYHYAKNTISLHGDSITEDLNAMCRKGKGE